jgi:hypothetical protein
MRWQDGYEVNQTPLVCLSDLTHVILPDSSAFGLHMRFHCQSERASE